MEGNYYIATSSKIGEGYNSIGKEYKIEEKLFWTIFESNLKDFTSEQPEKYEETYLMVKPHIENGKPVTIGEIWFNFKKLTAKQLATRKRENGYDHLANALKGK